MSNISFFSILFCLLILFYASQSDLRTRNVSNILWLAVAIVGLGLLVFHVANGRSILVPAAISIASTFAMSYLFFRFGLFGAADAKCLISMAVLFPTYPSFDILSTRFPLFVSFMPEAFPFALTTLINAALLALVVPLSLCLRNLFDLGFRAFLRNLEVVFTGYRIPIGQLARVKHVRLAHLYEEKDGGLRIRSTFRGAEIDGATVARLEKYRKQGWLTGKVWVTPDLPFMLFITAGFLVAALIGSILTLAMV